MKKLTEEKIQQMIDLYNDGNNFTEIGKIIGLSSDTVSKYLKDRVKKRVGLLDRYTEEQLQDICKIYKDNGISKVQEKYPELTKNQVYRIASNRKERKENYFWSEQDVKILKENYGKPLKEIQKMLTDTHTVRSIGTKAIKLNLTQSREWTDKEIDIFKRYYSSVPYDEFKKLLPNRTYNSIVNMGRKLGIKSYNYLQEKYSDDQKQFIIDNYKTMTDIELSEALDKPLSGIQEQRRKLGIYYLNKDYSGYDNLSKFFRGHIQDWKNASMKACNYQCILTGSKDFIIHHKYGFNKILQEAFEKMDEQNLLKSTNLSDYSFEELSSMLDIFQCIHNKYPLGVCIRKDIHDLFHQLYGSGGNTEEQWESFIAKYSNKLTA